jgi:hypothetical protein
MLTQAHLEIKDLLWTQEEAINFCMLLESFAPSCGCHIALTGGCLYSEGARKDLDIIIYSIRQTSINWDLFEANLRKIGFDNSRILDQFVNKLSYKGKRVEFLFPETLETDTNY